jgi:GNAT superfamily N-acetyltransferase
VAVVTIREAEAEDVEAIVRLYEADKLGGHGDTWTPENAPSYRRAFAAIGASPDNSLYVAAMDGSVVGAFQLTFIPIMTGRGRILARLEAVQVRSDLRSKGIGATMVAFAEHLARGRGARRLSLTSNKARTEAHRFYERLGYARSHEGFSKAL